MKLKKLLDFLDFIFFLGHKPPKAVTWVECRQEILKALDTERGVMILSEIELENGKHMKFEETPRYFKLTVGKRTWYWIHETGEFDGTSSEVESGDDDTTSPPYSIVFDR